MNDVKCYINTSGHSTRVACNFLAVVWSSRIWGTCREAAEPGGRLEEARGPRAPSGLIHPGGDSPKAHAWSPPIRSPQPSPLGPASPPSAPAAREKPKAPRTSGREPLPHLGRSVPTHPVRACQRSPPPIPEKPASWARSPSPLHTPQPPPQPERKPRATPPNLGIGTGGYGVSAQWLRAGQGRAGGRGKGRRGHSRWTASRPDSERSPSRTKVMKGAIATEAAPASVRTRSRARTYSQAQAANQNRTRRAVTGLLAGEALAG